MSDLGHYDNNPGYRYQSLFVAKKFKFGRDRTAVPNIEAEIGRGGPWFTGGLPIVLNDAGVNPVGAIFEPLTDDILGPGLLESDLHQASFEALRSALFAAGYLIAIRQSDQTDLRSYLAAVLEYFDGFLFRIGAQIGVGYWKTGNLDTSTLPIIGSDDLYAEQRLKSTGREDNLTEVTVIFKDRTQYYHDVPSATVRNIGLLAEIGEPRPAYLQRPFIVDADQANNYATQYLQRFSRPGYSGEIDVKLEKVEAIEDLAALPIVGQLVKLDLASIEEEIVVRVTDCEYPGDEGPFYCTLTVELERAIWPALFIQPPPGRIGNFKVNVPAIVNYALWELPSGLKTETGIQIAILAQRPAKSIVGFHVWDSSADITFLLKNPPSAFAAYGTLTAVYPGTTADIDQSVGMQFKLFGVDLLPPSAGHILDYSVLCFVDNEIMSVGASFVLGGGIYKTWMYRARYGSFKSSHAIGAKAFFILRENIARLSNPDWDIGVTWYFKLQTYDNRQEFDLADFTSFSHLFSGGAVAIPTGLALTSSFVITSENKVDSRITATWTYPADQDLAHFVVRIKKTSSIVGWVYESIGLSTSWISGPLEPNVSYDVEVQAINSRGEPSAWSAKATKFSAAPNPPAAPTGLDIVPSVKSIGLVWTPAATPGISQTQIGLTLIPFSTPGVLTTLEGKPTQFTVTRDDVDLGYFYSVRHLNSYGVASAWAGGLQGLPLTTVGKQVATPIIGAGTTGSGTIGTLNFHVLIVDQQGNLGPATIYFSLNDGAFLVYSKTGNYKSSSAGAVLPTNNNGEIAVAVGDKVVAYAIQAGWLQSATTQPFYNNATNAPNRDGTGGGTPIARLP